MKKVGNNNLSTRISDKTRRDLTVFAAINGHKIQEVVEEALCEYLTLNAGGNSGTPRGQIDIWVTPEPSQTPIVRRRKTFKWPRFSKGIKLFRKIWTVGGEYRREHNTPVSDLARIVHVLGGHNGGKNNPVVVLEYDTGRQLATTTASVRKHWAPAEWFGFYGLPVPTKSHFDAHRKWIREELNK